MTLVEVLVGTLLLVGGGGSLLVGMNYAMAHTDYLSQFHVAMNAAQGQLDQLAATSLDTLWFDQAYAAARPPNRGLRMCIGEDANCNGRLDTGEDANADNILDPNPLPGSSLAVRIVQPPGDQLRNPAIPALLDMHVAACWQFRGRRIGEDQNCNGVLDVGEDTNANGWIDSPAMVSTRVGRRD